MNKKTGHPILAGKFYNDETLEELEKKIRYRTLIFIVIMFSIEYILFLYKNPNFHINIMLDVFSSIMTYMLMIYMFHYLFYFISSLISKIIAKSIYNKFNTNQILKDNK